MTQFYTDKETVDKLVSRRKLPLPDIGDRFGPITYTGTIAWFKTKRGDQVLAFECMCECGRVDFFAFLRKWRIDGCEKCAFLRHLNGPQSSVRYKSSKESARIHRIWHKMKKRCYGTGDDNFKNYGGRGIFVCEEWRTDFWAFHDWARSNGYENHLTIERKDVNGNYTVQNCKWATRTEQQINKRSTINLCAWGEIKCATEWGRDPRCMVNGQTVARRLRAGISAEMAISTPPATPGSRKRIA